ncbi:hypothetical protein J2X31_002172 [Flavobacterium arsenatis]|uniref:Uncharacterized protein n=1 Tax=Flavobacterium arsenatis TaxID=1484332 RepID=A0ABU1TQU9_9FLAO|nr:hypothetical protein [Flavobacterium arsenatis]MDR6968157.1 hypothetical protein [Flavobacterium arsenatis]
MKKNYKFNEVLNDLMDYFILGDPDYLLQYKAHKGLPDDLLTEFTTKETGDIAVENGVIVPMIGIENYPYTIYFNLSTETPELLKPENKLQHKRGGYCLKVENERIYLYTIPYLKDFTATKIEALKKYKPATIELQNGWYSVTILGGLTRQIIEIKDTNGNIKKIETMEPTFEFIIKPTIEKPNYTADFSYQFKIENE